VEAAELMKRQLDLKKRKQRLLQLQQIDEGNKNTIRKRLGQLQNKGGQ
jgi:hypothetical protein